MDQKAFARIDLGLSTEEFFSLTPRQFDSYCTRHKARTEMHELLFAQLAAMVVNTSARAPKEPATIQSFMPSQWGVKPKKKRVTKKQAANVVDFWRTFIHIESAKNAQQQT